MGADDRPIVVREVRGAIADGWTLVAASCPQHNDVYVELAAGHGSMTSFGRSSRQSTTGSVTAPAFVLTVRFFVPHHVDRGWPHPRPVPLDRSCLVDPAAADVTVKVVSSGARFGSSQ